MPMRFEDLPTATFTTHLADDGAQVFEITNGFLTGIVENDGLAPLVEVRAGLGEAGIKCELHRYEMDVFEADHHTAVEKLTGCGGPWTPPRPFSLQLMTPRSGCVDGDEVRYFLKMGVGGFEICLSCERLAVTPYDATGRPIAGAPVATWMADASA